MDALRIWYTFCLREGCERLEEFPGEPFAGMQLALKLTVSMDGIEGVKFPSIAEPMEFAC